MSMLTDVQAVKGRFHWGNSTAWRTPGGNVQVSSNLVLSAVNSHMLLLKSPSPFQFTSHISNGFTLVNILRHRYILYCTVEPGIQISDAAAFD